MALSGRGHRAASAGSASWGAWSPDAAPLLRRRPLVAGAAISLATVIVLLVWLVIAAFGLGAGGLMAAASARSDAAAVRAARTTSFAFGLAVGPAVYMLLAAAVALT